MPSAVPSRVSLLAVLIAGLLATACNKMPAPFEPRDKSVRSDRDAPFDPPGNYPEWAYESPSYMKPVDELSPAPLVREGDPLHYFTNQKLVQIRQPANYAPEEIPRVAVWWTDNNGFHWHKAGYFGRGQTFFPFEVEEDGDYGIRFVGPGQEPAKETPAYPERVYHVDRVLPEVEVTIEPDQSQYEAGQTVTISWRAGDYHLIETPVSIQAIMDFSAEEPRVVELQRDLADDGSITYEISADAADHQIRFRVGASDRASNLGLAYSHALQVVAPSPPETAEAVAEVEPLNAESSMPSAAPEEESDEAAVTPAALSGTVEEPPAPPLAMSATSDPVASPKSSSLNEEEVIDAVEVDLLGGSPVVAPFAEAKARQASNEDRLTWDGSKNTAFPSGASLDGRRTEGRLFDTKREEHPVAKAAGELKKALAVVGEAAAAAKVPAKPSDADRYSMLPSAEEEPAKGTAETAKVGEEPYAVARDEQSDFQTPPGETTDELSSVAEPPAPPAKFLGRIRAAAFVDVTQGNGLMIPLPATVEREQTAGQVATIHPWRILGEVLRAPVQAVWSLPRGRLGYELNRLLEGRLLADNPALRAVAEPGSARSEIARRPEADGDSEEETTP